MKKILALALPLLLTAWSASADVIYQELFNYSNGPVSITSTNGTGSTTISNWITFSGNLDCYVNNQRLEVSSSSVNGALTDTRTGDVNRQFSMTNNSPYTNSHQLVYISFIVNFTNLPTANGTYFALIHYGLPSSSSFECRVFALIGNPAAPTNNFTTLPNTFRIGVSAAGQSGSPNAVYPTDLALNTDYQVVLGWDPVTLYAATIWINPVSPSDTPMITGDLFTPSAANIANSFAFRQASGFGGFLTVSNLVVATTYNEAVTNVLATNAVAPRIVYQPKGLTNFVGATFSLSAVANGQGLGSLNYQWRKGGSPYANPAGNANVLSFNSATAGDSGDYDLVVTTPYGLSVTSSVAKVLISVLPVPPSFTTQPPTNNQVYAHQNLILHVVASGPPTISYQWYQNNSPISDSAIFDGTGSDTLTIYDITVGNGNTGTFRCDATNPNGTTPSSNAVVTVISPQAVTIAYLRSLVDPVTYAPTNSSLAYQVTGIITPYTNSSSGNTASYFLQDATAGINIFATFASTFRPLQGDSVTYVGVLSSFSTVGTELYSDTSTLPFTSYTINSSGNPLPTPVAIAFDVTNNLDLVNYTLAGSVVKLSGVYFGANNGTMTPTNNYSIIVSNSAGKNFKLQFFGTDLDTQEQTFPEYASSVTGILYGGNPNFSLAVTKWSDIVAATPPPPTPVLSLATSGSTLTMTWTGASVLQASTNVAGPYTAVPGAVSPFVTNGAAGSVPAQFFRLYQAP